MSKLTILGVKVGPCEHKYTTLPVTRMASGAQLELPLHVYNGAKPGPVLALTSTSHGDEIHCIEIIRQAIEAVDLNNLSGTLLFVPSMNPIAMEWGTRNTPIDMYNMNRSFPGNERGWITEQMCHALMPLCDVSDYMIDWHCGLYALALNYIYVKGVEGKLGEDLLKLSTIFGVEHIYAGAPGFPGSIAKMMFDRGKVCLMPEIGGMIPFRDNVIPDAIRGVHNVMKYVGMYPGEIKLPPVQYLIYDRPLLRPKNGGLFYPICRADMLNRTVPKGTLIAQIRDPLTLEVIEDMVAPCEESLFMMIRSEFSRVHPGDYAYIIGEMATAEKIVNE